MKKKLLMILATTIAAASISAAVSADDKKISNDTVATSSAINLVVSGSAIECDQAPVIVEGRTLIPLRAVAEAVGADVEWVANTKTVNIDSPVLSLALAIGADSMTATDKVAKADTVIDVDVPAQIINGRTMVPVRVIAETLGLKVDWLEDTRTVSISVDAPDNIIVENTEETSEESTEEISEETSEEATEEISEKTSEEASEE